MGSEEKSVKNLPEDESRRFVKKHFHRFSKFLRYLDENNATILLGDVEPNLRTNQNVYRSTRKKDTQKIKNLVGDVLGISNYQVRDYYRTKLGQDDKTANTDRIRKKLGDILYGVSLRITDNRKNDLKYRPLSDLNFKKFYSINAIKGDKHDLASKTNNSFGSNGFESTNRELILEKINQNISGFIRHENYKPPLDPQVSYLKAQTDLLHQHINEKLLSTQKLQGLKDQLLKLSRIYNHIFGTGQSKDTIIPYYLDFSILSNELDVKESIKLNSRHTFDSFQEEMKDFDDHDLLYFRYEILTLLINEGKCPTTWPTQFQSLLIFCRIEVNRIPLIVKLIRLNAFKKVRFTIYTKFSNDGKSVQIDNITFDDLRYILLKYNFTNNPDEIFYIKDDNLIHKSVHKFPDYHSVNLEHSFDYISVHLRQLLFNHLDSKIVEDLHASTKITSKSNIF